MQERVGPGSRAPGSFRDPAGYVFLIDGSPYRTVNRAYRPEFDHFTESGLCAELQERALLIRHESVPFDAEEFEDACAVLRAEKVPLIAYPYEFCFSQLKDAALTTLEIQRAALKKGMSLKDASAYNIQFLRGKPLLLDTLSFELYREGRPWSAYRQFCEHFLAPLAVASHVDPRLTRMLNLYVDGFPLDLASKLCPFRTKFKLGLMFHLHLHAKAQAAMQSSTRRLRSARMSLAGMMGLLDSLESTIRGLKWRQKDTPWANYYESTNYSIDALATKAQLVGEYLDTVRPHPAIIWDLGSNTGEFSRIAAKRAALVVAWDLDPGAVELHYLRVRSDPTQNVLPLVLDLTNPSPQLGWANAERNSFTARANADVVMALALIHHLVIGSNIPLGDVARHFADLGRWLIIEFVPKSDSQAKKLLATRGDVVPGFTQRGFESAFGNTHVIVRRDRIADSERTLYLMERRSRG